MQGAHVLRPVPVAVGLPSREDMDSDGGGGSKAERFIHEQLATQRRNLLGICKMCVKSLVDKAAFEAICDDCPHLENFCTVVEHMFIHRIQVRWTLFSGSEVPPFWMLVSRLAPPITVMSVQDMESIQTDIGRCRAWIRLMLVQKRLSDFMTSLLSRQDILQAAYLPGAFLLSDGLIEIAGTVKCLDTIDFNLCLRDLDFDSGVKKEIDYTPYLVFQQSASSRVDDFVEEQKLSSGRGSSERVSFPWQPEVWAVSGEEEGRDEGGGGETQAQLREMLKTEREQKNYFEELVSVRDNQLSRLQSELTSLGTERDKERAELEVVVLELQQQLDRKHTELRVLQQKHPAGQRIRASTLSPSSTSPPPLDSPLPQNSQNHSSTHPSIAGGGRTRNSSFSSVFSGFLGSRTSN